MDITISSTICMLLLIKTVFGTESIKQQMFDVVHNKRYNGSGLMSTEVSTRLECNILCSITEKCRSQNFKALGSGKYDCELLSANETALEYLVDDESSTFYCKMFTFIYDLLIITMYVIIQN